MTRTAARRSLQNCSSVCYAACVSATGSREGCAHAGGEKAPGGLGLKEAAMSGVCERTRTGGWDRGRNNCAALPMGDTSAGGDCYDCCVVYC